MKPHPLEIEFDELMASGTIAVSQASPVVVDIDLADNDALYLFKAGEGP